MKNILIFLSLVLTTSTALLAQSSGYTVLKDSPLPAVRVHVDPVVFDMWTTNLANTAMGMRADVFLNDRFSFYGGYKKSSWLDGIETDLTDFIPADGLKKHNYLELNGYWHFKNKTRKADIPLVISSSSTQLSGGRTQTTTKYLPVPGTIRAYTSLKFGLHHFNTSMSLLGYELASNDIVKQVSYWGSLTDSNTVSDAATMQHATFFATGISSKRLHHLIASTSYGKMRNTMLRELYFDLYWGISQKFSNVQGNGRTYTPVLPSLKGGGWRFGWRKTMGIASTYMEFGARPGPKGKGEDQSFPTRFYTLIGLGFNIGYTFKQAGN